MWSEIVTSWAAINWILLILFDHKLASLRDSCIPESLPSIVYNSVKGFLYSLWDLSFSPKGLQDCNPASKIKSVLECTTFKAKVSVDRLALPAETAAFYVPFVTKGKSTFDCMLMYHLQNVASLLRSSAGNYG